MADDTDDVQIRSHELLFGIRRSARYHVKYQRVFDRIKIGLNVLTLTAGGATAILASLEASVFWYAVATSILAASSVVLDPDRVARLHNDLAREFIDLERAAIAKEIEPTREDVRELTDQRLLIEAKEPPPNRVIDAMAHNDLVRAMGGDKGELAEITTPQRWLAHIGISYRPDRLGKRGAAC